MKPATLSAIVTAVIALALPWSQSVSASSGIQRCVASDGTAIYTDRACPAFGAKALPLPGELLGRIAAEEARHADSSAPATLGAAADVIGADAMVYPAPAGRRSPQSGCARSKQQLLTDLRGSFALHDVNRLAESYHWVGKSNRQAQQQMLQLERMVELSLQQARLFDAAISMAGMDAGDPYARDEAQPARPTGNLQLTLAKGARLQVIDLNVTRYAGCYFARI